MRRVFCLFLLCLLLFSGFAQSVWIFTDTVILNNGYELHHKIAVEYTFIDIETNYTILDGNNITYVNNVTSSKSLIERDGHYNLGNYTTTINADIYKPGGWTVNKFYMRFYTNDSILDRNQTTGFSITTLNSTHKRYSYTYNPSNTLLNTSMGFFDVDIFVNCSNSTLYYFGNRTVHDLFSVYILDPPYNGSSTWDTGSHHVNLTWERGNNSDTDVVIRKNGTTNPTNPFDGYEVYNGTLGWFNESAETNRAYTVFSYNETSQSWSEGLNIPWAALCIWNVYNESKPSQSIYFNLEISNQAGDIVYSRTNIHGPHYIDYNNIPIGAHTTFLVSNSSYRSRSRDENIISNTFYNYTFYLPLINLPPGHGPEENYTRLYRMRVIDQKTDPLADVSTIVKKYINTTNTYETVTTFYTNGYGEYDVWLIPSARYKVFLEKDGYDSVVGAVWDTDPTFWGANYPKIFQMTSSLINITIPPDFYNVILFNGTMFTNGSIFVDYMDSLSETVNAQFYTYEVYNFTNTLIDTQSIIGVNDYQYWVTGINASRQHIITVHVNHTTLGWVNESIYLNPVNNSLYHDPGIVEDALTDVTGPFELGYVRFFIEWLPFIAILVILGRVEAGMGIFGGALYLALIGKFFNDLPAELWQVIPIIIIFAVLWYIVTKGKFRL